MTAHTTTTKIMETTTIVKPSSSLGLSVFDTTVVETNVTGLSLVRADMIAKASASLDFMFYKG
eukprot:m.117543 g.117543  ORF g.117543 m.117543 type:complete len:63 (-) comp28584_c8_seq1:386-574(-)